MDFKIPSEKDASSPCGIPSFFYTFLDYLKAKDKKPQGSHWGSPRGIGSSGPSGGL
jgi:hypothetical protein